MGAAGGGNNLPQIKNEGKANPTKIVEISRRNSILKLPLSGAQLLSINTSKVNHQVELNNLEKGLKKEHHHHST